VLVVFIQQRRARSARLVLKGERGAALAVSLGPVVDGLAGHAEHPGDVGGGPAVVKLQHGQGAPVKVNVSGLLELLPQPAALPGRQVELAHVFLHPRPS
jgi:hypothetical protein